MCRMCCTSNIYSQLHMCVQFSFLESLIIEVVISVAPPSQPTVTYKLQSIQEGLDIVITVDASYNFSHKRKSLYTFALMPQLQLKNTWHSTQSAGEQLIQKKMETAICINGAHGIVPARMSCSSTSSACKKESCVHECVSISEKGKTSNMVWWWKWIGVEFV
jgi:hypothetical protein